MGSPLQEKLIINLQDLHKATYMGLGGSFDIYVGKLKRAPDIFINLNLEWAFRLIREPQRFSRQLILIPFFLKFCLEIVIALHILDCNFRFLTNIYKII